MTPLWRSQYGSILTHPASPQHRLVLESKPCEEGPPPPPPTGTPGGDQIPPPPELQSASDRKKNCCDDFVASAVYHPCIFSVCCPHLYQRG
eukprot:CAMPEP_0174379780 /NCGR_PEP_ID=MMETSP0811_2-20130205/122932_1 /TAXON_ID=73025 ORGANISM="Eutreptiella gymnastica-like, Strain CCMP1594" /NCGR_SAMPLE_ID=MMETSP0811_2 /ASSEMBLY_ACC=CAM_ASM_000667 /LENGTH=90 /DNA_ID=CAMNT_0015532417 /DNA_START=2567 /DNA_END=2836 /DNA_ORIENTATION=+